MPYSELSDYQFLPHGCALNSRILPVFTVVHIADGRKFFKTFTEHPDGSFKDRDLYVFMCDFQGNCLAQGANPKMIGKNLIDMKDVNGKAFIKGMLDLVKTEKKAWYGPYKFNNIETKPSNERKRIANREPATPWCA
jgi:hypothetical protein